MPRTRDRACRPEDAAPASDTPTPRTASQPLVANSAEISDSARYAAISVSTMNTATRRAARTQQRRGERGAQAAPAP